MLIAAVILAPVGAALSVGVDQLDPAGAVRRVPRLRRRDDAVLPAARRTATVRSPAAEAGVGAGVGGVAGFLGGLLGVGGGNIILPGLTWCGLDAKMAAGTTALAVVFSSLSGFLGHAALGGLDPMFVVVMAVLALAGSLVGVARHADPSHEPAAQAVHRGPAVGHRRQDGARPPVTGPAFSTGQEVSVAVASTHSPAAVAPLGRLRGFHPGWFGAVMGTAVIGIVAYQNPGNVPALADAAHALGVAMVALAAILALVLGVPYVGRWIRHPAAALADLRSPVAGALYGTFPGGLLVLAVGIATVGPSVAAPDTVVTLVAILAVPGVLLAFLISLVFAYLLFVAPDVGPQSVNGGWFIPPVVNIIVPLVLLPLLPRAGRPTP